MAYARVRKGDIHENENEIGGALCGFVENLFRRIVVGEVVAVYVRSTASATSGFSYDERQLKIMGTT